MTLISDVILATAAMAAALYCYILAGRLRRFTTLESGMGGAIAVLSAQVDEMTRALEKAQVVAGQSGQRLSLLTAKAEELSSRLELLVASLHDIPNTPGSMLPPEIRTVRDDHGDEAPRMHFARRRSGAAMETAR